MAGAVIQDGVVRLGAWGRWSVSGGYPEPCFFAVERSERITPKSFAPSVERKPPEIFCRSFIIRPSRSARLFVKGTRGSVRQRSTSCLRVLRRSKRLWPIRRGERPRRLAALPVPPRAERLGADRACGWRGWGRGEWRSARGGSSTTSKLNLNSFGVGRGAEMADFCGFRGAWIENWPEM